MNAFALLALYVVAQPAVTVRFAPEAGAKFVYKNVQNASSSAMGNDFDSLVVQKQEYEVLGQEEGWLRMKARLAEFKIESDGPMGDMMGDPTGFESTFLISPQRKIKDWKVSSNGNLPLDRAKAFGDSAEAEAATGLDGLVIPETELSVGATWEQENLPVGMSLGGMTSETVGKLKTVYTVKEIGKTGKEETVTIEAQTNGDYVLTVGTPNGDFSLDVKQKESKVYTVRVKDGVVLGIEIVSDRVMSSSFGEFTSKVKGKMELVEK